MWWLLWVAAGVAALLLIAYLVDRRGRTGNGVTDRDRHEADRIMRGYETRADPGATSARVDHLELILDRARWSPMS